MAYRTQKTLKKLALAGTAMALIANGPATAQEAKKIEFDIDAQELGNALNEFGIQSGKEVYYLEADIAGKQTKGIEGVYSADEAINLLLNSTGISHSDNGSGTILIGEAYMRRATLGEETPPTPFRMAQVDQEDDVRAVNERNVEDEELLRDVIVVTGTNIRGIAPESSPVVSFDRNDILNSGASTVAEFLETVPQNFGGGSNPDLPNGLPTDQSVTFNGNANGSFGSSVNLRGLGSGSTLVLLNGRRLAPSSGIGDFVDISAIPATAVERVEILTDGASSIYGADAVAGVVNFILRDDFEGAEFSYRYGTVTKGGLNEHRANGTGGVDWGSGNALFVYEYLFRDRLSAESRSFSEGAPLPSDLLPKQETNSALLSLNQDLGSQVTASADLSFSRRDSEQGRSIIASGNEVRLTDVETESWNIGLGIAWELPEDWLLAINGTYSDVGFVNDTFVPVDSETITRDIDSSLWAIDAVLSGDLFDLPAGSVKLAVGGQYREEKFLNFDVDDDLIRNDGARDVFAAFGELQVPLVSPAANLAGVHRLELNVSGRYEEFSDFDSSTNPKVGVLWMPIEQLKLRGSWSTSFNPPALGRVGALDSRANVVSTAFFNNVFGFAPADPSIADVPVLTVTGTDNDLDAEESAAFTVGVDFDDEAFGGRFSVSINYFSIDFKNRLGDTPIPGGVFNAVNIAFNDPNALPPGIVVFNPPADVVQGIVGALENPLIVFPGLSVDDVAIINRSPIVTNLAETQTKGLDFSVKQSLDLGGGTLSLGLAGTYLIEFSQKLTANSPSVELLNSLYNPVDLRLRGNIGYSSDNIAANVFVNHTAGYSVDGTASSESIGAWTTVDLSMSYNFEGDGVFSNSSARFVVSNLFDQNPPSAPGSPNNGIFGFDPTNASPVNRFIAVELTKRF